MTKEQQQLWKDFDRNDIPGDDHMAICYARGIALAVFQWICMRCIVKVPVGKVLDDLPSKQLVELLGALFAYKANAATWCRRKLSFPGFTRSWVGKLLWDIPVVCGILSQTANKENYIFTVKELCELKLDSNTKNNNIPSVGNFVIKCEGDLGFWLTLLYSGKIRD